MGSSLRSLGRAECLTCGYKGNASLTKAIIMVVVRTGKMKINFFKKDPQAVSGGTGTA